MHPADLADLARSAVQGLPCFAVAIAPAQLADLARFGAHVLGDIAVLPAGAPAPAPTRPLLAVHGDTSDIFAHVVGGFARALTRTRAEIAAFLDAHDPARRAAIIAYLPVPKDIFGGRPLLAQDAAVSLALEDKASRALADALPGPPTAPLPWPCDAATWQDLQRRLGAETLVVQALGHSGAGAGTRIVDRFEHAAHRLADLRGRPLRAAPFIAGDPCNATALIPAEGPVIALPPSRQRIALTPAGRPLYAGNVFDPADSSADERAAIADDLRRLGQSLAALGLRGPFGVDFIRAPDGRRHYHDLNPRMNGAIGLVADALRGPEGASPLPVLLLARRAFSPTEAAAVEAAADAAIQRRPRARLLLSAPVTRPTRLDALPPSGPWRIDLAPLRATPCPPPVPWASLPTTPLADDPLASAAAPPSPASELHLLTLGAPPPSPAPWPAPCAPAPELADLVVTLAPGATFVAGDRLVLGELTTSLDLDRRLTAALGDAAPQRLCEAILAAPEVAP